MYKIKLASIYLISHSSGYYYLGMSTDTFSRWSNHYNDLCMNKHSSVLFNKLWNETKPEEWNWQVLEYVSLTKFKSTHILKGKLLTTGFRRHLLSREKYYMNNFSINLALNKDNKHFK